VILAKAHNSVCVGTLDCAYTRKVDLNVRRWRNKTSPKNRTYTSENLGILFNVTNNFI